MSARCRPPRPPDTAAAIFRSQNLITSFLCVSLGLSGPGKLQPIGAQYCGYVAGNGPIRGEYYLASSSLSLVSRSRAEMEWTSMVAVCPSWRLGNFYFRT